jgi:hypothetical protein
MACKPCEHKCIPRAKFKIKADEKVTFHPLLNFKTINKLKFLLSM